MNEKLKIPWRSRWPLLILRNDDCVMSVTLSNRQLMRIKTNNYVVKYIVLWCILRTNVKRSV